MRVVGSETGAPARTGPRPRGGRRAGGPRPAAVRAETSGRVPGASAWKASRASSVALPAGAETRSRIGPACVARAVRRDSCLDREAGQLVPEPQPRRRHRPAGRSRAARRGPGSAHATVASSTGVQPGAEQGGGVEHGRAGAEPADPGQHRVPGRGGDLAGAGAITSVT